jgi:hypothetical protein
MPRLEREELRDAGGSLPTELFLVPFSNANAFSVDWIAREPITFD